jgi:hypothetical protein
MLSNIYHMRWENKKILQTMTGSLGNVRTTTGVGCWQPQRVKNKIKTTIC